MEDSAMQDPPYRKKVYDLLKSNYSDFGRTEEEFYTKLDKDTGYAGKVHELLSKDFSDFKRPAEEFKSMISTATPLEKKSPGGSQVGSQGLQATPPLPSSKPTRATPLEGLGGPKEDPTAIYNKVVDETLRPKGGQPAPKIPTGDILGYEDTQRALSALDKEISGNKQVGRFVDPARQARLKALTAQREKLKAKSDAAIADTEKDVNNSVNKGIGEEWKSFLTPQGTVNIEKIGDFARAEARKSGVPEDGYFFERVKNAAKGRVELEKITPIVDSFLKGGGKRKGTYEELYGAPPEDDAEGLLSREDIKKSLGLSRLDTEVTAQISQLNKDISKASTEEITKISTQRYGMPVDAYAEQLGALYQSQAAALQQTYAPLINQEGLFAGTPEQYEAYQQETEGLNQAYRAQVAQVVSQNMLDVAATNNKANTRFNRQRDEILAAYQAQYLEKAKGINPLLQERYKKAYKLALEKAMEVDNATKETRAMFSAFGQAPGAALGVAGLVSGASNITSSLFRSLGMKEAGEWFEQVAENYDIGDVEIKSWGDMLDPTKVLKSTSYTIGGMSPMLLASFGVGAATQGIGAGALMTTLAAGTAGWGIESMSIVQEAYDQKFKETGSASSAESAANKALNGQLLLMPMYALEMVPFFGDMGKHLAKVGMDKMAPRIVAGGVVETAAEMGQEYPQGLFEKAIADDKELSAAIDYASVAGFENTLMNVAPTTFLLGGAGGIRKQQSKEEKIRDFAKTLSMQINIGELTETVIEQKVLQMTVNAGQDFAKHFISVQFSQGKITEEQAARATAAIERGATTLAKAKEYKLDNKGSYVLATLDLKLEAAKVKAEAEQDPTMKAIAEETVKTIEGQVHQLVKTGTTDVALIQFPNGDFDILTHEEARRAMANELFMKAFQAGDLKFEAMGKGQEALMADLDVRVKQLPAATESKTEEAPIIVSEDKVKQEDYEPPLVFTTPTEKRYAVMNRGDGKGDVVITKAEYDAEIASEKPAAGKPKRETTPVSTETQTAEGGTEGGGLVLYHGSPHKFDVFDTSRIGSGEGAQAFGTGLYFTNEESIASGYANKLGTRKNFWDALEGGHVLNLAREDFDFIKTELGALGFDGSSAEEANIGDISVEGVTENAPDVLEAMAVLFGKNAAKALEGYDLTKEEIARLLDIKKKISDPQLYRVAVHEGKSPSQYDYMEWREELSQAQLEKLGKDLQGKTGQEIYEELSKKLGGSKQASEYLLSKGIDGITYKSNKGTGGTSGKGRNYVVFDSKSIRVDAVNGTPQLNKEAPTPPTNKARNEPVSESELNRKEAEQTPDFKSTIEERLSEFDKQIAEKNFPSALEVAEHVLPRALFAKYKALYEMAARNNIRVSNERPPYGMAASWGHGSIQLNKTVAKYNIDSYEEFVETLNHEIIHGLISSGIRDNYGLSNSLQVVMDKVVAAFDSAPSEVKDIISYIQDARNEFTEQDTQGEGEIGSLEELITYAFTNTAFAKFLDSIPASQDIEAKGASIFQQLKNIIREFISTAAKSPTALDEIGFVLDKYFDTTWNESQIADRNKTYGWGLRFTAKETEVTQALEILKAARSTPAPITIETVISENVTEEEASAIAEEEGITPEEVIPAIKAETITQLNEKTPTEPKTLLQKVAARLKKALLALVISLSLSGAVYSNTVSDEDATAAAIEMLSEAPAEAPAEAPSKKIPAGAAAGFLGLFGMGRRGKRKGIAPLKDAWIDKVSADIQAGVSKIEATTNRLKELKASPEYNELSNNEKKDLINQIGEVMFALGVPTTGATTGAARANPAAPAPPGATPPPAVGPPATPGPAPVRPPINIDKFIKQGKTDERNREAARKTVRERVSDFYTALVKGLFSSRVDLFRGLKKAFGRDTGGLLKAWIDTIPGAHAAARQIAEHAEQLIFGNLDPKKVITVNMGGADVTLNRRQWFSNYLVYRRIQEISRQDNDHFRDMIQAEADMATNLAAHQARQAGGPRTAGSDAYLEAEKTFKFTKGKLTARDVLDKVGGVWTLKQRKETGGNTVDDADVYLRAWEAGDKAMFDEMKAKAQIYFDYFRALNKLHLDGGLLTQEEYDGLVKYDYTPMHHVKYLLAKLTSEDETRDTRDIQSYITALKAGSTDDIAVEWDVMMSVITDIAMKAYFQNEAVARIAEAVKAAPGNGIMREAVMGADGKWAGVAADEDVMTYSEGGEIFGIIVPTKMVEQLYNKNVRQTGRLGDSVRTYTFVTLFKAITTNYNLAFGTAQLVWDTPQALLASHAYSSMTLGMPLLVKDLLVMRFSPKEYKALLKDAAEHGALTSFTREDRDTLGVYSSTGLKELDRKLKNNRWAKSIEKWNEATEHRVRVAIYAKMLDKLSKKYWKENPPTSVATPGSPALAIPAAALKDIKRRAAAEALNVLNYSNGGTWIKPMNQVLVYLNPAIQAQYSMLAKAAESPKDFMLSSMKAMEFAAGAVGLMVLSLALLSDDDEEQAVVEYITLERYQRDNYTHVRVGDGWYRMFRKPNHLKPFMNKVENIVMKEKYGEHRIPDLEMWDQSIGAMNVINPLVVATGNPAVSATLKYFGNYDAYRGKEIVKLEGTTADYREGLYDDNVGTFYKYIGKQFKDAGMPDAFSPKRADAAAKALVGNYDNNPSTAFPLFMLNQTLRFASGEWRSMDDIANDASLKPEERDVVQSIVDATGFPKRFMVRVPIVSEATYELRDEQAKKREMLIGEALFTALQAYREAAAKGGPKEGMKAYALALVPLAVNQDVAESWLMDKTATKRVIPYLTDKSDWVVNVAAAGPEFKQYILIDNTRRLTFEQMDKLLGEFTGNGVTGEETNTYFAAMHAAYKAAKKAVNKELWLENNRAMLKLDDIQVDRILYEFNRDPKLGTTLDRILRDD